MKRILVIGATGRVGREVVSQLLAANADVRALVRNPDCADLPASVEIVPGNLTIPATLDTSLHNVDAAFLVWCAPAEAAALALARIAEYVPRVVYLSAPHRTPHPFFQQTNPIATLHKRIEGMIEDYGEASGLQWTFPRPGMFASNALRWWAPQLRKYNAVRWPYADVPTAPIDERDIANSMPGSLRRRPRQKGLCADRPPITQSA